MTTITYTKQNFALICLAFLTLGINIMGFIYTTGILKIMVGISLTITLLFLVIPNKYTKPL